MLIDSQAAIVERFAPRKYLFSVERFVDRRFNSRRSLRLSSRSWRSALRDLPHGLNPIGSFRGPKSFGEVPRRLKARPRPPGCVTGAARDDSKRESERAGRRGKKRSTLNRYLRNASVKPALQRARTAPDAARGGSSSWRVDQRRQFVPDFHFVTIGISEKQIRFPGNKLAFAQNFSAGFLDRRRGPFHVFRFR